MPKYDFWIDPPLMNAAGSLGFAPDGRSGRDWSRFGAFITHPISWKARSPAQGTRFLAFSGGFLLHTGFPNPGLHAALRRYASAWARARLPVIVHLLAENPAEVAQMVRLLEGQNGVAGVEIGLPPQIDPQSARALLEAAAGELWVAACLPFDQALQLAPVAASAGVSALSLGPPRGALPNPQGKIIEGRLYGRAVFPLALPVARSLLDFGLPVLAGGGVYSEDDLRTLLELGAAAVQLDAWLWLE